VRGYDPVAGEASRQVLPEVILYQDPYQMADGCDALIVVTPWNEFKQLDLEKVKNLMRKPVILDGRNIYNPAEMRILGFVYRGIGRGTAE